MILFLFAKVLNQSAKDRSQSPPPPSLPMSQKDQIICEDLMKLLNWIMILRVHAKCPDSLKHQKCIFCLFLSLCRTVSQPYRLSHINALCINQSYKPKTSPWNFQKNMGILKNSLFLSWPFWIFFFSISFSSCPWKLVKATWLSRMGQNFDDYPGFQPKITQPISASILYHVSIFLNFFRPTHSSTMSALVYNTVMNIWHPYIWSFSKPTHRPFADVI